MDEIFVDAVLVDKVKIKPRGLCQNKQSILQDILINKFEGKCSYHGYIKRGSIKIIKCSAGQVKDVTLNGDTEYLVSYRALVCNPIIGSIVRAKVVNQNKFGILAEVTINGTEPVLEIIITKMIEPGEIPLDKIKVGDMVNVEILKKRFELNDDRITNVGKIIHSNVNGGNVSMIGGEYVAYVISDDEDVEDDVIIENEDEDADADADGDGEGVENAEEEDPDEDDAASSIDQSSDDVDVQSENWDSEESDASDGADADSIKGGLSDEDD